MAATKNRLKAWILEALQALGGSGHVLEVSRAVWERHEVDLQASGDLFFTWQYDLRWAAKELRDEGALKPATSRRGPWELI
jgi:hypothetical protein